LRQHRVGIDEAAWRPVTLKGPVRSEEEKQAVASKAATIVKPDQITNRMTIAPRKK
jgi:hypothetical protein